MKLRSAIAAFAVLAGVMPASASALGPGGWDNLGERPPAGSGFPSLFGSRVDSMNSDSGKLIVGGVFDGLNQGSAATPDDDHVAVYDGRSWSTLGPGAGDIGSPAQSIHALEYSAGKIYAAGTFADAGPSDADFLATWDTNNPGAGWQPVCGGPLGPATGHANSLLISGTTLFVGGPFDNAAGIPEADSMFACDLATGTPAAVTNGSEDIGGDVKAIVQAPNGKIYVGGQFIDVDGIGAADYVAEYLGGTSWSALGASAAIDTVNVDSLATDAASNLYVGTDDVNIAGIPQADHIARWNGATWSALGSNTAATDGYLPNVADVQAIAVDGARVFAFGNWTNADGNAVADRVASFDTGTSTWSNVGSNGAGDGPINCNICAGIAIFHGKLHVGGNFVNAGGDPLADSIACFPLGATPCIEPAPTTQTPAQPATPTPQQAAPPKKCRKGQKLKKGKCVKKKRKKR